jgi:hypothetical protein
MASGMRTAHWGLGLLAVGVFAALAACDESAPDVPQPDAGDAGADVVVDAGPGEGGAGDGGGLVDLQVSPLAMTPAFSPDVHDYAVRCAAGDNPVTVTMTTSAGTNTLAFDLLEDQAVVVQGDYWIRCLPHDFPELVVTTHADAGAPTPGYYLLNSSAFAMALDTRGTPVWYQRGTNVLNVDSPAHDTLTFSPNASKGPYGVDTTTEFDIRTLDDLGSSSVQYVGNPTDGHELLSLKTGNHIVQSYIIQSGWDLTGLKSFGSNETMVNCSIQEVDGSGNVVWSWLATDHVDPVQESVQPVVNTVNNVSIVDPFHCNAVDVDATGNLLVSMRHASAVYYVDRSTGSVLWKLGGTTYNKDGAPDIQVQNDPQTTFSMQHDARLLPNGDVTMFDNHGVIAGVARCVEYSLDHNANTASVVWQYLGIGASSYEGSCRRYADGESVVGWGHIVTDPRVMTEVDANGNDVLDVAFADTSNVSYRAVKVPLSQLDIGVLRTATGK